MIAFAFFGFIALGLFVMTFIKLWQSRNYWRTVAQTSKSAIEDMLNREIPYLRERALHSDQKENELTQKLREAIDAGGDMNAEEENELLSRVDELLSERDELLNELDYYKPKEKDTNA